jgi:hypothetical protein
MITHAASTTFRTERTKQVRLQRMVPSACGRLASIFLALNPWIIASVVWAIKHPDNTNSTNPTAMTLMKLTAPGLHVANK